MRNDPSRFPARAGRILLWCLLLLWWAALCTALQRPAAAAVPGDLWEDRMQMEMSGLPAGMGAQAQVHQRCSARNADTPPMADDRGRCDVSDVQRSASGMRWKMRCQGDPPMSGSGEIHYDGRDAYHGRWTMDVGGQTMSMKMDGRRIGDCDADATRRQVAAARQQAAQAQQQVKDIHELQCKSAVDNLMSRALHPDQPYGCGAAYKQRFCARLQTAAVAAPVCDAAEQQENLDVLAHGCTVRGYGRALTLRECAGRNYSSPPAPKYADFCSAVASQHRLDDVAAAPPASPAVQAMDKGRQLLKGLFGR